MRQTISRVEDGLLYHSETSEEPIVVGTPAWYDWLEHHSSFLFADLAGSFTARKSGTEPGAQDWEAFRTHAGKLDRLWLGPSRTLTLARLQAAAQALTAEPALAKPISVPPADIATSQLPAPESAAFAVA